MNKKIYLSLLIGIILIHILYIYEYISSRFSIEIPCFFHKITGFYCPGCGLTRMLLEIIHGNMYQAFRYNPLMFVLFIISIPYFIYVYVMWIKEKIPKRIPQKVWIFLLMIFSLYGLMRNLEYFSYLKPTVI